MVGWNFPNSEICVRVARYEFSKNHPTFPTKYINYLYISKLYGRFSVVFFSQKIYPSYFFFQNRHFLVKKIFLGQTDPFIKGPPDPPGGPFTGARYEKRTFYAISEIFSWHDFCIWATFLKFPQIFLTILFSTLCIFRAREPY